MPKGVRSPYLYNWCQEDLENRGYLLEEWCYQENSDIDNITPQTVKKASQIKVWWKCRYCNHKWRTVIYNRTTLHQNCPRCKHMPKSYEDSLEYQRPDLMIDWCYDKNNILPSILTQGSRQRVNWRCHNCGRIWVTKISNRAIEGTGCPNCFCRSSISEQLVHEILNTLKIRYKSEWVQTIGINNRRYDFYLVDLNLCIEIDGLQHFEETFLGDYNSQRISDIQKNNYLLNKCIPLLRIPGLDAFNIRLKSIKQTKLDKNQFRQFLENVIKIFTLTRKIPDEILEIYKDDSDTNYYQIAIQMNKL